MMDKGSPLTVAGAAPALAHAVPDSLLALTPDGSENHGAFRMGRRQSSVKQTGEMP